MELFSLALGCSNYQSSTVHEDFSLFSLGIFGGMRAAMQLRAMLSELGTLSVSNIFGIPEVQKCFDEEGNPTNDHMESGAKKILDQLDWYTEAMKNQRDKHGIPQ